MKIVAQMVAIENKFFHNSTMDYWCSGDIVCGSDIKC